jgi:thiol-disulfide isomerase/thioredoxin
LRKTLLALLLAALTLTGCTEIEGTGGKGYVTSDGQLTVVAADDRGEPVTLSGETLDGEPLDIADFRGKPVVVNIWWSGCAPCRTEAPLLKTAQSELGDTAAFLGLNIRDSSPENGKAFERSFDIDYPSLYAPDGSGLLAFRGEVPPNRVPSTIVLDAEGRVAAKIIGEVRTSRTLIDVVADVAAP